MLRENSETEYRIEDRQIRSSGRNLTINFSNVVGVGDADAEGENARKLALIQIKQLTRGQSF